MKTPKQQRGMTAIGWGMVLAVLVLIVMMVLKLVPVYMESYTVSSTLKGLAEENKVYHTAGEVRQAVNKRLSINNVKSLSYEDMVIAREGDVYTVEADYEVRVPFVYNIDFMVSFNLSGEARAR